MHRTRLYKGKVEKVHSYLILCFELDLLTFKLKQILKHYLDCQILQQNEMSLLPDHRALKCPFKSVSDNFQTDKAVISVTSKDTNKDAKVPTPSKSPKLLMI